MSNLITPASQTPLITPPFQTPPTKDQLRELAKAAEARVKERHNAIQKLYEDQQKLKTDGDYWFDGTITLTSLVFYSSVKLADMNFSDSSTVLEFNGTMWGPAIGVAAAYGGGYTHKDPDWFVGKEVDFELIFAAGGVSGIQMTFWYEGSIVGAFNAIGTGGGVGGGWGDGEFKKVS
jgi:hypothetical protein